MCDYTLSYKHYSLLQFPFGRYVMSIVIQRAGRKGTADPPTHFDCWACQGWGYTALSRFRQREHMRLGGLCTTIFVERLAPSMVRNDMNVFASLCGHAFSSREA